MPRPKPRPNRVGPVSEIPWDEGATCKHVDPALFFDDENAVSVAEAKKVCRACPVRAACLERALAYREPAGVWGGMTHPEREALIRQRKNNAADAA